MAKPEGKRYDWEAIEADYRTGRFSQALTHWRRINEQFVVRLTEQLDRGVRTVQLKTGDVVEIDLDLEYIGKCINHGTGALERVVKMERTSYGLDVDSGEDEGKSLQDLMGELSAKESDE